MVLSFQLLLPRDPTTDHPVSISYICSAYLSSHICSAHLGPAPAPRIHYDMGRFMVKGKVAPRLSENRSPSVAPRLLHALRVTLLPFRFTLSLFSLRLGSPLSLRFVVQPVSSLPARLSNLPVRCKWLGPRPLEQRLYRYSISPRLPDRHNQQPFPAA
jgi:hypothetical protein